MSGDTANARCGDTVGEQKIKSLQDVRHLFTLLPELNLLPTPKVATGGGVGILTGFIIYELTNRFHVTIAPEEAAFLTVFLSFISSYLAPHSDPTPEQIAEIKKQ